MRSWLLSVKLLSKKLTFFFFSFFFEREEIDEKREALLFHIF